MVHGILLSLAFSQPFLGGFPCSYALAQKCITGAAEHVFVFK